jgi:hypothetical protein
MSPRASGPGGPGKGGELEMAVKKKTTAKKTAKKAAKKKK